MPRSEVDVLAAEQRFLSTGLEGERMMMMFLTIIVISLMVVAYLAFHRYVSLLSGLPRCDRQCFGSAGDRLLRSYPCHLSPQLRIPSWAATHLRAGISTGAKWTSVSTARWCEHCLSLSSSIIIYFTNHPNAHIQSHVFGDFLSFCSVYFSLRHVQ